MMYAKTVRIPADRIGVLIGRAGAAKKRIEGACGVRITVDSGSGEVVVEAAGDVSTVQPFKATEMVTAIGRGFSADKAMLLLKDSNRLHVVNMREFSGKSGAALERVRSRIIGEGGRARRNIEKLGRSHVSVYGKTVSIIGDERRMRVVINAVTSILEGGMHAAAYSRMEASNRKEKMDRMLLWKGQEIGG